MALSSVLVCDKNHKEIIKYYMKVTYKSVIKINQKFVEQEQLQAIIRAGNTNSFVNYFIVDINIAIKKIFCVFPNHKNENRKLILYRFLCIPVEAMVNLYQKML